MRPSMLVGVTRLHAAIATSTGRIARSLLFTTASSHVKIFSVNSAQNHAAGRILVELRASLKLRSNADSDDVVLKSASRRSANDFLQARFWPAVGTCPLIRLARFACGQPEETSRYRLPPANRSRRVCLCAAQRQNTPHSRIPVNAPTKSGDQDVEVTEKKQFPVSSFSGGWNLTLGSGKRRVPERKLRFRRIKNSGVICCAQSSSQNGNPG